MSKPKPRASEPPRASMAKPAVGRKSSGPSGGKFYVSSRLAEIAKSPISPQDGPTVPSGAEVKIKAQEAVSKGAAAVKSRKTLIKAKRHPSTVYGLLGTLPLLLIASLFSTVFCPPPSAPHSTFSRLALAPLGLDKPDSPHSAWHQALCYPANVYHRDILEPYVYPAIAQAQTQITQHPIYTERLQPAYVSASKGYNRAFKPVIDRTVRGARKFYLYYLQPHLPYLRSKFDETTAPLRSKTAALHQAYLAPHLATAQGYARTAGDRSAAAYQYAKAHPLTEQAGLYANKGYKLGTQAYFWSKPRAIQAAGRAELFARQHVSPRILRAASIALDQTAKAFAFMKVHVTALYHKHVNPHVAPYVNKAALALSPYYATFNARIYEPFVKPLVDKYMPAAPEPPKSFWQLIADKLPALSALNVAESRGSMDNFYAEKRKQADDAQTAVTEKLKAKTKTMGASASSMSKSASSVVSKVASTASVAAASPSAAKKDKQAELLAARDEIKARVEKQGQRGYESVQDELARVNTEFLETHLPRFAEQGRNSLDREINHMISGLDKLYINSKTLTRDQVKESSQMTDAKVAKVLGTARDSLEGKRAALKDAGEPAVRRAKADVHKALGDGFNELADKMALADATQTEWDQYHALKKDVEAWQKKYQDLLDGASTRQLKDIRSEIGKAIAESNMVLNEIYEGFRVRLGLLRRAAIDRIEAREAQAEEAASSTSSFSAEPSRVSILPIAEAGGVAAAAGAIIGKGKEQVMQALAQADAATSSSSANSGRVSILPIEQVGTAAAAAGAVIGKGKEQVIQALGQANAAVSSSASSGSNMVGALASQVAGSASSAYDAASSAVHEATRSAISAVGATPSPESPREHVESLVNAASASASSVYEAAASVAHDATRAAASAVGASQSPETPSDYLESIAGAVKQGYASVADAATSKVHDATRAGSRALGGSPPPENLRESAQSVIAVASASAASLASAASDSASSLLIVASSAVHDATRSASSAVGATPTPETAAEYAESLAAAASSSASSLASVATASGSSLLSVASQLIHDATRSAVEAVGATPSPESPGEHARSLAAEISASASSAASVASESAASLVGAASSAVHDATRSASVAVGATPSPESLGEHVVSLKAAGGAAASSALDAVKALPTEPAARLASGIKAALGVLPSDAPLASQASAYASSLVAAGTDAGSDLLESASSFMTELATEAYRSLHSATRAAARAAGATPSPESAGEYMDVGKAQLAEARRLAESYVKKHASTLLPDIAASRDDLERHAKLHAHEHAHGHAHGAQHDEL